MSDSVKAPLLDPEGGSEQLHNSGAVDRGQAEVIANGGTFEDLRTNATLRDDQWQRIDDMVLEISQETLVGVSDLRDNGLDRDIDIGTMFSKYETASGTGDAEVSLSGEAEDEKNRATTTLNSVPVPFIHKGFSMSARANRASQRGTGQPLPETQIQDATFRVSKKAEDLLFNGGSRQLGGDSIEGYTSHPDRNTVSGSDWSTNSNVFSGINSAMKKLDDAEYPPPWILYVSNEQASDLRSQSSDTDRRLIDIIREYDELQAVRRAPALDDGNAVLVKPSARVVDLQVAEDITAIEAESKFGRTIHMQVAGVMAPRVKSDDAGNSGVVHLSSLS